MENRNPEQKLVFRYPKEYGILNVMLETDIPDMILYRKRDYAEFDSDEKGCYSKQEQEMVADWLSTKQVFKLIYSVAIHGKVFGTEVVIKAIQQLIMLYWVSLTIEFQIFDSKHTEQIDMFLRFDISAKKVQT